MVHLEKTNLLFRTSAFNLFIVDYEILLTCNSLLIYKCEEKPYIKMTNKNIKYLLKLQLKPCYSMDLVATANGQDIV
jgi:hypothetical protein